MVLQPGNNQAQTPKLRNLFCVLADMRHVPGRWRNALPGASLWAGSQRINPRNMGSGSVMLDQDTYMDVVRWRSYWESYQASHFVRLPAEAVADIHAAMKVLGHAPVNWYCSGCITEALRLTFEAVEAFEAQNGAISLTK